MPAPLTDDMCEHGVTSCEEKVWNVTFRDVKHAALRVPPIRGESIAPVCAQNTRETPLGLGNESPGSRINPHTGERRESMSYYLSKIINDKFDKTVSKVIEELRLEGFGILTEIDVTETLKRKLNVVFPNYTILGACNPSFAYRALQAEPHIGVMLPCNVIIRELEDGKTEVSAVDPLASMQAIHNGVLLAIAGEIQMKLKKVIEQL
jgi:uncharacterized protein (DUF302 family)